MGYYREAMLAGRYDKLVSCAHCDCWRAGEELWPALRPAWNQAGLNLAQGVGA